MYIELFYVLPVSYIMQKGIRSITVIEHGYVMRQTACLVF